MPARQRGDNRVCCLQRLPDGHIHVEIAVSPEAADEGDVVERAGAFQVGFGLFLLARVESIAGTKQ